MRNIRNRKSLRPIIFLWLLFIFVGVFFLLVSISRQQIVNAHTYEDSRDGYSINDIRGLLEVESGFTNMELYADDGTMEMNKVPIDSSSYDGTNLIMASDIPSFNEQKIVDSGKPDSESIVITIMGDGFTATEQATFINAARTAMNYMLGNPSTGDTGVYPYNLFRDVFSVYAIEVISNESGVSRDADTNNGDIVDNYFGSSFYYGNNTSTIARALVITNYSKANELEKPNSSLTAILCNSIRWGGTGGSIAVSSMASGFEFIFIHEFAHTFGGLADEYYYPTDGPFNGYEAPNRTATNDSASVKWSAWIGYNNVGVYPYSTGVDTSHPNFDPNSNNWYKPHTNCAMQTKSQFCPVCATELIARMETIAGPLFNTTNLSSNNIRIDKLNLSVKGSFTIPERIQGRTVSEIGTSSFSNQSQITLVSIPASVTNIGSYAFEGCTSLSSITIPNSVTTIGVNAFYGCNNLTIYITGLISVPDSWNNNWNPLDRPIYFDGILHTHNNDGCEFTGNNYHAIKYHFYEYRYYCTQCKHTIEIVYERELCSGPPCIIPYSFPLLNS